jgi:hypothetical protein
MIDWSLVKSNADIVSYYKGMLEIRKNFSPLTDNTTASASNFLNYTGSKDPSSTFVGVWTNTTSGEWNKLAVLANNSSKAVSYTLKEMSGVKDWVVIADDTTAGVKKLADVTNGEFTIPARSIVVAVDKASFDSVALKSNQGSVKVSAVNTLTGDVLDSYIVTGTIGSKYSVDIPSSVGEEYELSEVIGNKDGTFTEADQSVTFNFGYYVPESVKTDLNGDGKVNINDVTYLQRAIAKIVTLSDETKADLSLDGKVDINDVTMLQKYLADMSVGTGTVTVNYYATGTTDSIATSTVYSARVGSSYTSDLATALGYSLNKDNLPQSTVTVAYGNTDINYYYDYVSADVTLHVKHNGSLTWAPSLWIWGSKNGVDSGTSYNSNTTWPGDTLSVADDGWYSKTFTCKSSDNSYNLIVSNAGSPQTTDCKGFTQSELWIYIDDEASSDSVSIICYDVNPETDSTATPVFQS